MKKYIFLLFWYPLMVFSEVNIVFVHIGGNIPSYSNIAFRQAKIFNEEASIYFLANRNALDKMKNIPEFVQQVSLESLTISPWHEQFIKKSLLDRKFRGGFWLYTTERFFYLEEFARQYDLRNIFHLENDVMLYCNLEEMLPVFEECYPTIGATFDCDTRVIFGFGYFNNSKPLTTLAKFLSKDLSRNNEMLVISKFRGFDRKAIDFLPIIFPRFIEDNILINKLGNKPANPKNYCKNFEKFNSVFDAAALGQYIGGGDPRNIKDKKQRGPGFINETAVFNSSHMEYKWICDDMGRKSPYISYKDELIRINNLHIHSKELEKFTSKEF